MAIEAYYNGLYSKYDEVKIGLYDRALFFGDGVYDVILGGGGKLYQPSLHLKRLKDNARAIGLTPPEELMSVIERLAFECCMPCFSLYVQLSRAYKERIHAPEDECKLNLLAFTSPCELAPTLEPISAVLREDYRYSLCHIKTLNLLPNVLASRDAMLSGCQEAIFTKNGTVTEGAKTNVFIIKDGVIKTHPLTRGILPGITRRNSLLFAREAGIECREECFSKEELFSADEILVTSTTKLARRIGKLDGVPVGCKDEGRAGLIIEALYRDILYSLAL